MNHREPTVALIAAPMDHRSVATAVEGSAYKVAAAATAAASAAAAAAAAAVGAGAGAGAFAAAKAKPRREEDQEEEGEEKGESVSAKARGPMNYEELSDRERELQHEMKISLADCTLTPL
ncbi:hypothetical protein HZH66_001775 [Vespula vulgaris]|uniref:Uncharacterized protein n=1 Tax=Vespula vulgaris TaxID=7454 RepID=A0A834NH52_VESVU|nr:hypothetical protein HZH66_001775 [Vespula vulgaris]